MSGADYYRSIYNEFERVVDYIQAYNYETIHMSVLADCQEISLVLICCAKEFKVDFTEITPKYYQHQTYSIDENTLDAWQPLEEDAFFQLIQTIASAVA